jgi:hypothetical protein
MKLKIDRDGQSALSIHYRPNHSLSFLFLGASVVVALLFAKSSALFIALICFALGLFRIFSEREISCIINRITGIISYKRGGILGSSFDAQEAQFTFPEINALEMKRRVARGGDLFQIRLALSADYQLNLSSDNLSFSECQELAEEIRQFIGIETPLRAVD